MNIDGGPRLARWLMFATAALSAASVVAAFIVAPDRPSRTQFVAAGNRACDRLTARTQEAAGLAEDRGRRALVDGLAALRRTLDDTGAPEGSEARLDKLVDALREIEDEGRRMPSDPAIDVAPGAIARAATSVEDLGLDRCTVLLSMNRLTEDRVIQSFLRNAFAAEKVYYTDFEIYTESVDDLLEIEPALTYEVSAQPVREKTVYVKTSGVTLYLSGRSASGRCFYIQDTGEGQVGFAIDPTCRPAEAQQYGPSW